MGLHGPRYRYPCGRHVPPEPDNQRVNFGWWRESVDDGQRGGCGSEPLACVRFHCQLDRHGYRPRFR